MARTKNGSKPNHPRMQISEMTKSQLALIRHDVQAIKTAFSIGGSVSLPDYATRTMPLRVNLPGNTFVDLPINNVNTGLDPLINACMPATYGLDSKDVLDKSYRDALQLQASDFAINFNLAEHDILAQIRRLMVPHFTDIRAELYNINVYGQNGHFKPHRDTPRKNMFGSLVVCLPSNFEGGQMLVRHKDMEQTYDWSSKQSHSQELISESSLVQSSSDNKDITCHWAAFFSNCEHEITPVTLGHRITITYNLYPVISQDAGTILDKNSHSMNSFEISQQAFYKTLRQALASKDFMPSGGTIGFCMEHSYPLTKKKFKSDYGSFLKGGDAIVYFAVNQLGMSIKLRAIYTRDQWKEYNMPNSVDYWNYNDENHEDYNFDNDNDDGDVTEDHSDVEMEVEDEEMTKEEDEKEEDEKEDDEKEEAEKEDDEKKEDEKEEDEKEEDEKEDDDNYKTRKFISSHFIKDSIAFGEEEPDFETVCREHLKGKNGKSVIWITQPSEFERGFSTSQYGNCAQVNIYYVAGTMLVKVPKWGEGCREEFDHEEKEGSSSSL